MRLEDFDYELPAERIAQRPLEERDGSRLLAVSKGSGSWRHRLFSEIVRELRPGDLLVLNDTRVFAARLFGRKRGTGGKAELLLVHPVDGRGSAEALSRPADGQHWICLGQAAKGLKEGAIVELDGGLSAEVVERVGEGELRVRFSGSEELELASFLSRHGNIPLPPYIARPAEPSDAGRYQTVYSRELGSVAAPTAGLHFTERLLSELEAREVEVARLTLHVGPGTFLPVRESPDNHVMHPERFFIPAETAMRVNAARAAGRRRVAVGTTVVRALEAATDPAEGFVRPGRGETALFIRPGYEFRQVDALVTNFHLPRSTLLLLVAAFLGREATLRAYREAISQGYRFYSYGDAMLIET